MVQDHRDRALSTRPSPYTHLIARASTGLALSVRSSTITGPAGGEGRVPNRQRGVEKNENMTKHDHRRSGGSDKTGEHARHAALTLVSERTVRCARRVEQGVAWTRILCAMWSPDRRRGPDHRQSSRETCSW
ncbi:unnamed protein product [Pylaiella littoralis]